MTTPLLGSSAPNLASKYLTVVLADESYGIAILKVREIIRFQAITIVPQMPDFVRGVINLRDRIIPIVDLRVKFGLDAQTYARTFIVVVEVSGAGRRQVPIGLIVDGVEEVVNLEGREIGAPAQNEYLLGMARVRDRVKALLDIDRVLSVPQLCTLEEVA